MPSSCSSLFWRHWLGQDGFQYTYSFGRGDECEKQARPEASHLYPVSFTSHLKSRELG